MISGRRALPRRRPYRRPRGRWHGSWGGATPPEAQRLLSRAGAPGTLRRSAPRQKSAAPALPVGGGGQAPRLFRTTLYGTSGDGRHTVSARSVGLMGAGRALAPVRKRSTPLAAERPSAMAHTISDWPRPASPATYTPGTLVAKSASRAMLPRSSSSRPNCSTRPFSWSVPVKPMARVTSWAGIFRSVPGFGSGLPSLNSTSVRCSYWTLPSSSPSKWVVETE